MTDVLSFDPTVPIVNSIISTDSSRPIKKFKIVPRKHPVDSTTNAYVPIVFTRYLYIKEEVFGSLMYAILDGKIEESFFWGYELYYSGFQEQTMEFLSFIYQDKYAEIDPKLGVFITSQISIWKTFWKMAPFKSDHILAIIIRNLIARRPTCHIVKSNVFIMLKKDVIEPYKTLDDSCPRTILQRACLYTPLRDTNIAKQWGYSHVHTPLDTIIHTYRYNWLYYACYSPIWASRMCDFDGRRNDDTLTVDFEDDEDEDAFYEKYGYEPDEQPLSVQVKNVGIVV